MGSWLTLNWPAAFTFFTKEHGWKRKVLLGGLWIALFPPVGWLLALGYRKAAVIHLIENDDPFLPEWREFGTFLADGAKAALVIMVYFMPYMLTFWLMALNGADNPAQHAWEIGLFFLLMPICLPACMLGLPVLFVQILPWIAISAWQIVALGAIFSATLFVMPAAFGQLSLHGTFRSALHLYAVLRLIRRAWRGYLEAWSIALLATAVAFLLFPLAPWGIFISYLVASYAFNNALALAPDQTCRLRFANTRVFSR